MNELVQAMAYEANIDLKDAHELFRTGSYARTLFFCQQALEKVMKAGLMAKGRGTLIEHNASSLFAVEFTTDKNREKLSQALETAYQLEELFGKTRYPKKVRDKIYIPSKAFTKEFTQELLEKTEKAFKTFQEFIKE